MPELGRIAVPGWSLAIDFGTTATAAAMAFAGLPPQVLEIEGSRYFPSLVYRDETGQLLTGQAAVSQARIFPERAERVPKRALVAGPDVILGGRPVPVTELVAAVLGRVYAEAVRYQGRPPSRVVLTHPARWAESLRGRLRDAAVKAGITDPEFLAEPVAAACWYARPSAGALVAVFDLGGGTLDTAVLRASGAGYELAGPPGGDADLGGEDFDDLLLSRLSALARGRDETVWHSVFSGDGIRSRRDLALVRADVRSAKHALSEHNTYDLAVVGFAEAFRLTRREFDALIAPHVDEAVEEMRRTMSEAGVTAEELSGLFLTGGSSRIPLIASRLAALAGGPPRLLDDPKAVVALGAVSAADPGYRGSGQRGQLGDRAREPGNRGPGNRHPAGTAVAGRGAPEDIQRVSTSDLVREFGRRVALWLGLAAAAAVAGTRRAASAVAAVTAVAARELGAWLRWLADALPARGRAMAARAAQWSARAGIQEKTGTRNRDD